MRWRLLPQKPQALLGFFRHNSHFLRVLCLPCLPAVLRKLARDYDFELKPRALRHHSRPNVDQHDVQIIHGLPPCFPFARSPCCCPLYLQCFTLGRANDFNRYCRDSCRNFRVQNDDRGHSVLRSHITQLPLQQADASDQDQVTLSKHHT